MKKHIVYHFIALFFIFIFVDLFFLAVTVNWISTGAKRYFSSESVEIVENIALCFKDKKYDRRNLNKMLDDYSRTHDYSRVKFLDANKKTIYANSIQHRKSIAEFASFEQPVMRNNELKGYLKIWLAPGFVGKWLFRENNLSVFALIIAGWFVTLVTALMAYVYAKFLFPMGRLGAFAEHIEKEEFIPINLNGVTKACGAIFGKLNLMNAKLAEANDTLHVLFQASQSLSSRIEISEIFNSVLEIIQKKFPEASGTVQMLGEDGFLRIKAHKGVSPDFVKNLHLRPGEGFAGLAYQKCQVVVVNDAEKEVSQHTDELVKKENIASHLHIPLMNDAKCVGVLNIIGREKNYFSRERIRSFSTLAEYLSIAIRNMELYERVQELNQRLESEVSTTTRELIQTNSRLIQKVREMKALSDIAGFMSSKASLSDSLQMIVDKIKDLLSAQAAGFFLYNQETNELIPHHPFFGIRDKEFSRLHFRVDENSIFETIFNEGRTCLINDEKQALESLPLLTNILAIHSLALVPLRSGKKIIGIIGVANKFNSQFDQNDVKVLELIADRVTGVIENVRLYQELEHRLHDLTTLQEISSAISGEPIWEQILKKIVSSTTQSFNADLCAILLYSPKTNELLTQTGAYFTGGDEAVLLRIPVDDPNSVSTQVFRSGEAFISPDASIDPRIKSQTARLWDLRSLILVPLKAENRVIGVLRIGRHQSNCFTKDHLRLAMLIGHQAAVIIENAQLYESLRETKVELERLNQVKNEFISIVSHELRTPITAIKGFVKVILQGDTGELNQQQQKFLQIVDQSVDRLAVLISDLLDISRIESGQFNLRLDTVDPKELIKLVTANLTSEFTNKNINLVTELPSKLPMIMADRERLMQVFDNLILNAAKFTPNGGEIRVSGEDKGDYVLFKVVDTGIGIASGEHKKIFEKFYQIDSGRTRSIPGAGLGLAIVKSIVEIHGGQIWVESELGKGSAFQFIIPRLKKEINDYRKDLQDLEQKDNKKQ
ncbi:MAG: GAF domain-containing protein [Elusimicrobiota bacterium]